jgi:nitroreductase
MLTKAIKAFTPQRWHSSLGLWKVRVFLPIYYWRDFRHLFLLHGERNSNHIACRFKLIKYYHRLEKALSTPGFKIGRGFRAAEDLLNCFEDIDQEFFTDDSQFAVARQVLEEFLDKQDHTANYLRKRYQNIIHTPLNETAKRPLKSGSIILGMSYFMKAKGASFDVLSSHRHSVRDFEARPVSRSIILEAVGLAQRTPSVCNRQGWQVVAIQKPEVLSLFRQIHKGFTRPEQYLSTLLVICFTKSAFDYPVERNQGFIDGGLFSMSLMHAFTHLGVGSCPLNANITLRSEKKFRKAIGLSDQYGIVLFMAVGHYKDETIVPVSHRDSASDKIIFL